MSSNDDDAQALRALGDHVKRRREELHLSQIQVGQIGGPSTTTLSKLEQGEATSWPAPSTIRKLEQALEWRPGTVQRIRDGGEPVPVSRAQIISALSRRTEQSIDVLWRNHDDIEVTLTQLRERLAETQAAADEARQRALQLTLEISTLESKRYAIMEQLRDAMRASGTLTELSARDRSSVPAPPLDAAARRGDREEEGPDVSR